MINTVYLVFSKMEKSKMSFLILFFFYSLDPAQYLWVFQITMPENGLATAECDFTEREAVWTGFLYGLIIFFVFFCFFQKRPYYLIFSVVKKFKQIWESGALVLWRSIAWLLCI